MLVNFVYIYPSEGWHRQFVNAVYHGLSANGINVNLIDLTGLSVNQCRTKIDTSPKPDLWYTARHNNWMTSYLAVDKRERVVTHIHGGGETGCFRDIVTNVGMPNFDSETMRHLCGATVNSEHHFKLLKKEYAEHAPFTTVTGFPLDFSLYTKFIKKKKDIILVPGRFIPSKQPILLSKVLAPWKHLVVFSSPERYLEGPVEQEICDYLTLMGYSALNHIDHPTFIDLLSHSKVVVTASMADTLNLSMIEGSLSGANIVVPQSPPFSEYSNENSFSYKPFNISEMRACVENAWVCPYQPIKKIAKYQWQHVTKNIAGFLRFIHKRTKP